MKRLEDLHPALIILVVLIVSALMVSGAIMLVVSKARAHEAPSGWKYPLVCCSNKDCRRVTSEDVAVTPDGYLVRRTGEVIPYGDKRIKKSGDNDMHLCQQYGDIDKGRTLCLFDPPRGF